MSPQGPEIIAYAYEFAPNPQKLIAFLGFFGIPYKYVEIPPIMPRPQLAAIGITHRRTPLLSINSDMYIDNALIISRLSDMAQHSDSGLEDATNRVEYDGLGQQAFRLAVGLLPMDHPMVHSKGFIEDRSDLIGGKFDIKAMADARPHALSQMLCFLELIQGHFLKGDRKFFLGGQQPTTADMYVYGSLNWGLRYHGGAQPEITSESHPEIFAWLDAIQKFIDSRRKETKSNMDEAYEVLRVPPKHEYARFVPHVEDNIEGLKQSQKIEVTPTDSGKSGPQRGTLISLNLEQVCLRNEKDLVMHFPRLGFSIKQV